VATARTSAAAEEGLVDFSLLIHSIDQSHARVDKSAGRSEAVLDRREIPDRPPTPTQEQYAQVVMMTA
jgi:hypothetical protein